MKSLISTILCLSILIPFANAREKFAELEEYVKNSESICICTVDENNDDGGVAVTVDQILKGSLGKNILIKGNTGHCVIEGPINRFMEPENKYLVFLFKGNTLGRLGGIIKIEDKILIARYIHGFKEGILDQERICWKIPLERGIQQIKDILNKQNAQPGNPAD